jgi:hypothetical protein
MIVIKKGENKRIVLSLNDNTTSISYDVLFEFESIISGNKIYFTSTDLSLFAKYSEFELTEGVENYFNGSFILDVGQYRYKVHQMPVSSPKSLDVSNSIKVLDYGRVTIWDDNNRVVFDENETKNNITFE